MNTREIFWQTAIIICLLFSSMALAQTYGHDGTLTNGAAWGDGVIANPIPGATWTTGPLPTPPEFAYDYDWENDATYDLTDAGDSVCHTYTPGDSLWAMVKTTTATYTAEDSAEVIVPEGEEIIIEPTLLFSIPIPAGDTVALGEPTEDGRFPVSFTFGGMNDGVIRIYDTTGTVVDSFPNAHGRDFDISPNGNLVFVTGNICSDSLSHLLKYYEIIDPCNKCLNKNGEVLFETVHCPNCNFSENAELLGRKSFTSLGYETEYDLRLIEIMDTLGNRIFSKGMENYDTDMTPDFQWIWKAGFDTLWLIDINGSLINQIPDYWGELGSSESIDRYYSGGWYNSRIDENSLFWRIATIDSPTAQVIVTAYDTSANQVRSLSVDINGLYRIYIGVSDLGDYLWILETLGDVDSCRVYSTEDSSLINAFTIPISHDRDSTKYNLRYTSIAQTQVFKLPDNQVFVASYLVGLAGMGRFLVSDGFGNSLFEIPSGNREDYQITGDGKYLFTFRDNSIYLYRIWR